MIQYATITAPFDGVITKRLVHAGAFIQPAERNSAAKPLLQVTRTDVVRIILDISMAKVRWLNRGDRAVLDRITALPGATFEGNVSRFSPALDTRSRMMRVEIDLPNTDGRLRSGFYGYVTVFLDESPQTPVVPASAVITDGIKEYVCMVQDGQGSRQQVMTNYEDGTVVGVESGLRGGEHIVRSGGRQLSNGQQVTGLIGAW